MKRLLAIAALATTTFASVPAQAADSMGKPGRIRRLIVLTSGSDDFPQYQGSIVVKSGHNNTTYKWGGSLCSGRNLTADQVNILAIANRTGQIIRPRFKNGQAGSKCLVGFHLRGH